MRAIGDCDAMLRRGPSSLPKVRHALQHRFLGDDAGDTFPVEKSRELSAVRRLLDYDLSADELRRRDVDVAMIAMVVEAMSLEIAVTVPAVPWIANTALSLALR
ncbi:hypothetical protein [Allomesorhizobium alhagi]|uniref:hypothetical protein n=1 Tax=Allomesorhizobium alhagi TaxID=475067 RepID=UPI00138A04FF|nr:hypothetical protein [Mesorhizobium alhagi]